LVCKGGIEGGCKRTRTTRKDISSRTEEKRGRSVFAGGELQEKSRKNQNEEKVWPQWGLKKVQGIGKKKIKIRSNGRASVPKKSTTPTQSKTAESQHGPEITSKKAWGGYDSRKEPQRKNNFEFQGRT